MVVVEMGVLTGVGFSFLDILTIPLTNARPTSVGKNKPTNLLEGSDLTVTVDGGTDLFGTGSNCELALHFNAMLSGFLCNRGRTRHVLIRRIGAGTNKRNLEVLGPAVLLHFLCELRDRSGEIRGEWPVDVRLQLREVKFYMLIVLGTLVGL